jgi:hypothetical protein
MTERESLSQEETTGGFMNSTLASLIILFISGLLSTVIGQTVFSASPGAGIASASFGIERGKMIPYVGLDVVWLSFDINTSDSNFDMYDTGNGTRRYESSDKTQMDFGANLIIPHFGLKFVLNDNEDVRTYMNSKFFFSLPFVKMSGSDTHSTYYWEDYNPGDSPDDSNVYTDEYEMNEDVAKDVLSFIGLSLGYGAEYKFSSHFGVASEFGVQMLFNSFNDSDSNSTEWSDDSYGDEWSTKVNGALKLTYVKLSFIYKI